MVTSQASDVVAVNSVAVNPDDTGRTRLTLAPTLGNVVDGAWWPRTTQIARELPGLVSVLAVHLGAVTDIKLNWTMTQNPPDFNLLGWEATRLRVISACGEGYRANLLIVPGRTSVAVAVMVLRLTAGLQINPVHLDTRAYRTADAIMRTVRMQSNIS